VGLLEFDFSLLAPHLPDGSTIFALSQLFSSMMLATVSVFFSRRSISPHCRQMIALLSCPDA